MAIAMAVAIGRRVGVGKSRA
ncbi:hypothetical protein [Aeoliella sp.]